jgi:hypothetical protein
MLCALQVHEYEGVMARVQPVFKPLLKPHLEDMEKKVAPGMFILTWASMNIDGYLHRFKQVGKPLQHIVDHPHTHFQAAASFWCVWLVVTHICCCTLLSTQVHAALFDREKTLMAPVGFCWCTPCPFFAAGTGSPGGAGA